MFSERKHGIKNTLKVLSMVCGGNVSTKGAKNDRKKQVGLDEYKLGFDILEISF